MTAILNALTALNQSLENLEIAAATQEQKALKLQQQDLFNGSAMSANGSNGNGHYSVDPAILAKKLDITIERIEQVLREG